MRFVASLSLALMFAGSAHAEVSGEDHPLLPRYPNAEIALYRAPGLDRIELPVGPVGNAESGTNVRTLEGQVTHIDYAVRPTTPSLQVARYYEGVLRSAGYRVIFSCSGAKECGTDMGQLILLSGRVAPAGVDGFIDERMRVIVAQRGNDWVLLKIEAGPDKTAIYEAAVDGAQAQ